MDILSPIASTLSVRSDAADRLKELYPNHRAERRWLALGDATSTGPAILTH